jgi:hypothetical protein
MKEFEVQIGNLLQEFPDFISGSPTSTKVLGQDEKIKAGSSGITQEESIHTEESQNLKSGVAKKEEVQPEIP